MTTLAAAPSVFYGAGVRKSLGIRIEKPEAANLWLSQTSAISEVGAIWKVLVAFTYIFSIIGLTFAFSV